MPEKTYSEAIRALVAIFINHSQGPQAMDRKWVALYQTVLKLQRKQIFFYFSTFLTFVTDWSLIFCIIIPQERVDNRV